jgi:hypothetical protein
VTPARPTLQQERWITVASRLGLATDTPWLAERIGGWRAARLLTRGAFFILGVIVAALTTATLSLIHVPGFLFWSGALSVAAAEWLIARRRLIGTGVEEALEVAGLFLIAFQVLDLFGNSAEGRSALLLAVMLAVAGFRMLNPFFTTSSAVAASFALSEAGAPPLNIHVSPATMASVFCFAVASGALLFGRTAFRRPSHDQMLNWLVAIMPLAAYLWLESDFTLGSRIEVLSAAASIRFIPTLTLAVFGIAALLIGLRRRNHAPIVAFMVCCGCIAYELRYLTGLSLKAKLMLWGTVALLLTLWLDRYLRKPRRGLTSENVVDNYGSLDLLQLAGVGALTSQATPSPGAGSKGGGGEFGGGGASGRY